MKPAGEHPTSSTILMGISMELQLELDKDQILFINEFTLCLLFFLGS